MTANVVQMIPAFYGNNAHSYNQERDAYLHPGNSQFPEEASVTHSRMTHHFDLNVREPAAHSVMLSQQGGRLMTTGHTEQFGPKSQSPFR